jgi:hypothetical protein
MSQFDPFQILAAVCFGLRRRRGDHEMVKDSLGLVLAKRTALKFRNKRVLVAESDNRSNTSRRGRDTGLRGATMRTRGKAVDERKLAGILAFEPTLPKTKRTECTPT